MLSSMRRTNPKYFYKKFRKRKKTIKSNISLDDCVHHLKKLVSKDNIIDGPDNDENYEVIFEELDQSFTDQEIEICVKKFEKR
jgi:hypothetical protein